MPALTPTEAERALLAEFDARGAGFATARIGAGLPTRRTEAWKWSDLRAALSCLQDYGPEDRAAVPDDLVADVLARNDIAGTLALGLAEVVLDNPPRSDGWVSTGGRAVLSLEVGADEHVTLLESVSVDRCLLAGFSRVRVAPMGSLTRVVVQTEDMGLVGLHSAHVTLGAHATFRQIVIAEGAQLARIETYVDVQGEGAQVELNGVYMCGAGRHVDLTSVVEHRAAGASTRQLIKGVARKGGRGVFQGKIVVERGAQKTDARQYHHGMLLEDGAEVFAKPELMIHADDVQCAHGNTAGGLDERALFYMRSRGLPEAQARALLIESFLVEAIPDGLPEALNEELTGRIRAWLDAPLGPPASSPAGGGAAARKLPAGTPAVQERRRP